MVIFNKLLSFLHNYFDALLLEFLLSQLFTLLFICKESDLLTRLGRTSSRLKYPLKRRTVSEGCGQLFSLVVFWPWIGRLGASRGVVPRGLREVLRTNRYTRLKITIPT